MRYFFRNSSHLFRPVPGAWIKRILFTGLLFFTIVIAAQWSSGTDFSNRPENAERSRDFDALHYRLTFRFDEKNKSYRGENVATLSALKDNRKECTLDAEDFTVNSVVDPTGKPLSFSQTQDKLKISLPTVFNYNEKFTVVIRYSGRKTERGFNFIDKTNETPSQIITYSWPDNAHHWFPCYDFPNDKVTHEIIATVKNNYNVLSNGRLLKVTEDKVYNTKTFHWQQDLPHPTCLITLVAGPFEIIEDSLGNIPIHYWVYPEDRENAARIFKLTPSVMEFFINTFNYKYPWAKYDQVCWGGMEGGIENTTATALGHGVIQDIRADQDFPSSKLIAHELAHQWWGDLVTERSWNDIWLSEGFATYSEYLYSAHALGPTEGALNLLEKKNHYLKDARNRYIRPIVCSRYNSPNDLLDSHSYPKSASVLHMLRFTLGDRAFFRALNRFLTKYAFNVADTHDFINTIKETTGENLDWFFNQWLYKPGHPVFQVRYTWNGSQQNIILEINQTQDMSAGIPVFKTPVIIRIDTPNKTVSHRIFLSHEKDAFKIKVPQKPLMVKFDHGDYLLYDLDFKKSKEELMYQVKHDDVPGRIWAAKELMKYKKNEDAIQTLIDVAQDDPFWAVRLAALDQLASLRNNGWESFFKERYADSNSKVRAAAVFALGDLRFLRLVPFFKDVFKKDQSYLVQAQALLAIGKSGAKTDIDFLKKASQTKSPMNIINENAALAINMIGISKRN